jgi:hypothetical protein
MRADEAGGHGAARRLAAGTRRRRSVVDLLRRVFAVRTGPGLALPIEADVRIRYGRDDDAASLIRLAELDEAPVPLAPVLVAEVGGEAWAARSLRTGDVVANPFRRTAQVVELLAIRADQLRATNTVLDGDGRSRRLAPRRV